MQLVLLKISNFINSTFLTKDTLQNWVCNHTYTYNGYVTIIKLYGKIKMHTPEKG